MHPLLVGGNPYSTTSIYLLIQYLEWKWGVYYAEGGTGKIVDALEKLLKNKFEKSGLYFFENLGSQNYGKRAPRARKLKNS